MAGTVGRLTTVPFNAPGANPIDAPGYVSARALGAGVAESITVPSGAAWVRLAGTADFFYSFTATAAVPTDTDDGTACELIKTNSGPEWRKLGGATTISVISSGTPIVTASFYGP
jgi:hypothetical protein